MKQKLFLAFLNSHLFSSFHIALKLLTYFDHYSLYLPQFSKHITLYIIKEKDYRKIVLWRDKFVLLRTHCVIYFLYKLKSCSVVQASEVLFGYWGEILFCCSDPLFGCSRVVVNLFLRVKWGLLLVKIQKESGTGRRTGSSNQYKNSWCACFIFTYLHCYSIFSLFPH